MALKSLTRCGPHADRLVGQSSADWGATGKRACGTDAFGGGAINHRHAVRRGLHTSCDHQHRLCAANETGSWSALCRLSFLVADNPCTFREIFIERRTEIGSLSELQAVDGCPCEVD